MVSRYNNDIVDWKKISLFCCDCQAKDPGNGNTGNGSRSETKLVVDEEEEEHCGKEVVHKEEISVEAKHFLEAKRSSFGMLWTLQWTGWP